MKTLHLYLARQMLATLGMTVFVFTLVLLLGNVIKQILELLVKHQITLGVACHGILLLIPYVLAFSLPIGMLTAALLVFGRFSADQELTAARASGVSLVSLITPVLLLSVAVSGLCAWLNFDISPASRTAYKELIYSAQTNHPINVLRSGESVPFGNNNVWVGKVDKDGVNLEHIIAVQWLRNGELKKWAEGATGALLPNPTNSHIMTLWISNAAAWQNGVPLANADLPLSINLDSPANSVLTVQVSDMTFAQLREKLHELERPLAAPIPHDKPGSEPGKGRRQIQSMVKDMTMPVMVCMHREVAFSFACIGFTLIGIPLGIRAHRRETSIGVATALLLMLIYYSFIILAQAWENHPERSPCIIVWVPNFIFQAVGAVLLWQANRGTGR